MTTNPNQIERHQIDATGQVLGRLASQVAVLLRGKHRPNFTRHLSPAVKVEVINAAKVKWPAAKATKTIFTRYTGYPGGLRQTTRAAAQAQHGYAYVLTKAIKGMLSRNRLRDQLMKQLTITE